MKNLEQKITGAEKDENFQNFLKHLKSKTETGKTPYCGFNAEFMDYSQKYPEIVKNILNQQ